MTRGCTVFVAMNVALAALASEASAQSRTFYDASDFDGTAVAVTGGYTTSTFKQYTQELRIASPKASAAGLDLDAIEHVAGLFYLHQRIGSYLATQISTACLQSTCPAPSLPGGPTVFGPTSDIGSTTGAGFFNASWRLTDPFTLTVGLRYNWEEKSIDFVQAGEPPLGIPFLPLTHYDRSQTDLSPTLGLRYEVIPDVSIYGAISRGYKSGGYNADNVPNLDIEFGAESVTNYELGLKSLLLDHRVRFNTALYYEDYKDLQVQQFLGAVQRISNAAKARIYGAETELSANLTERLTFDLGFSYINAKFLDFPNADRVGTNYAGNRLPSAPTGTGHTAVEYALPFAADRRGFIRGEWTYRGATYFQASNVPFTRQGGYSLFNARAGMDLAEGKYQISVFGNNLGNKLYTTNRLLFLGTQMGFWGAPRTYGVEASAKF